MADPGFQVARSTGLDLGAAPPKFTVRDVDGEQHTLQEYRGRVLVLHFWATWCRICQGEITTLQTLRQDYAPSDVAILAVSVEEDSSLVHSYATNRSLRYTVAVDDRAARSYQINAVPTTFVIDRLGRIALRQIGGGQGYAETVKRLMQSEQI